MDQDSKKKLRIAHVAKSLDPSQGGLTSVLTNMAVATANFGADVEIWTADAFGWKPPIQESLEGSLKVIERKGHSGWLGGKFADRFAKDLHRVDLVHTHSFWEPYTASISNHCKRRSVPNFHTMHGMFMKWPMEQKTMKKQAYLSLRGKKHLQQISVVQMLNSRETEESRLVGHPFSYLELPNGVDIGGFEILPESARFKGQFSIPQDSVLIASLGRLHPVKGPDMLLDAFLGLASDIEDVYLVLAGPDEGMLPELQSTAQKHAARERVFFPGLIDANIRSELLADVDIFAQCSLHEAMSMSIIEAAYAEKCLLLTETCNFPEFEEGNAGMVVPCNKDSIELGLRNLYRLGKERRTAMGKLARAIVDSKFNINTVTADLMGHYEQLLSGHVYPAIL